MSLIEGSLVAARFLIEGFAGQGGMGEVFRARDVTSGARVALKLLDAHEGGTEEAERFEREARLLARLHHPGIVSYVAHGQAQDGRPFLAMEWLAGQDLSQRLTAGPLGLNECGMLLAKVADALAVAHRQGVVHRDIKPSNLFLRDDRIDGVTLLDFGIARWALAGTTLTYTGRIIGTPSYMAPEQASGERNIAPGADVFSLGCVLFECLTGKPPFTGSTPFAVLAKIVFDDAPPVEALRPDVPPGLSILLSRMLDKDPETRLSDAAALCDALAGLKLPAGRDAELQQRKAAAPSPAVLASGAMTLLCVVLAVPLDHQHGCDRDFRNRMRVRLVRLGGEVEWLADGSLAVIVPAATSALDQAAVAARCALAVREHWPGARVALATGRGVFRKRLPAGEAIERAASLLRSDVRQAPAAAGSSHAAPVTADGVWVDELSAKLLERLFLITTGSGHALLTAERANADESRPLLGRPTPCVGREPEISILSAAFQACVENSQPAGAIVIAPAGMGKSRLRHEFLRRLCDISSGIEILSAGGAAVSAGSPNGLLGEAIRRLCEVRVGDSPALQEEKVRRRAGRHTAPAEAERVSEFLAVLCGIVVQDPSMTLRAARNDPKIMADQIQCAFVDFLGAETAVRPVLLVLEDLHWGDAGTVKLVDAALLELRDRPFFVLAFARPEVQGRFPNLWEGRPVQRFQLSGLSKKAAEVLIAAVLGTETPADTVARIVARAAGNALFLEELIRAAAEGRIEEQPDTVLAILQAKMSCLDAQARGVLCGASIFGQTFRRGGVMALLGQNCTPEQTDRWLDSLVQTEMVERQRSSRFPEDVEYKFRHVLVRDAAYGLLPEDDRIVGHRLAGLYLEQAGASDPVVLAEHMQLGADMERAAIHYLRAAEQSYQSDDHDGILTRSERGIACEARGELLGKLLALKLEVCFWRQDWLTALRIGKEALDFLPRGSVAWSRAITALTMISGNICPVDEFSALVDMVMSSHPDPDALASYCIAAASAVQMLSTLGMREPALHLLTRIEQIEISLPAAEVFAHGLIAHSRALFGGVLGEDLWWTYGNALRAEEAFERARASRWHGVAQCVTALVLAWLGQHQEAERRLRGCLARALRSNDAFLLSFARVYLMCVLAERRAPHDLDEICRLARELIELGAMELSVGVAYNALALALMQEGHLDEARAAAEKALETLQKIRCSRPRAYAALIEVLLRQKRPDAARQVAEEGLRCLESLGGCSGHSEVALRLAVAEAHAAAGDIDAAREALADTIRAMESRAAKIPDPAVRSRYLNDISEHVRARELARTWLDRLPQAKDASGRRTTRSPW